jgi:hypothetical protein
LIREGQIALAAGNAVGSVVAGVAGNLPLRPADSLRACRIEKQPVGLEKGFGHLLNVSTDLSTSARNRPQSSPVAVTEISDGKEGASPVAAANTTIGP